ncbi:MAG: hypothetical protein ACOX6T_00710 [Myxococcales bacterium]
MSQTVDPKLFPRVAAYIAQLPDGLASYPQCQIKGALFRSALSYLPLPEVEPGALPDEVLKLVREPPRQSDWIPEVAAMAYNVAYADARKLSDAEFLDVMLEANRRSFAGPIYKILLGLASPYLLVAAGGARWGTMHRGSTLTIEKSDSHECDGRLAFPPRLFTELMLLDFSRAMQAALEASRAKEATVTLTDWGEEFGFYVARWK